MKNTFGNNVTVTLFGESHGKYIGATIDGISSGIKIDEDYISSEMKKRMPFDDISTERKEQDKVEIISGVYNGYTQGTPITVIIKNENAQSSDYINIIRPGHCDYTNYIKYNGYFDYHGAGHSSGRLSAPIVAVGAICRSALQSKNIVIGTHIKSLHKIYDIDFCNLDNDINLLNRKQFAVLNEAVEDKMRAEILKAKNNGDSVGGVLETAVLGLCAGVGEPWFDSVESMLSHALFSIPAVKGVSFGLGFDFAEKYASEANDIPIIENGEIHFKSNNNGGINGGITNGMPLIFSTVIKPTPSIAKEQDSVDLSTMKNVKLSIKGRHDSCIVPRAGSVVNAMTAIVLCDLLETKYGTDYFCEERK